MSLAYKAGGGTDVDIGIVGILQGDPDIEFYRLTTNPLYNTGQQSTKSTIDYDQLFDSDQTINTRPDAERVLSDLKALKDQIDSNTEVLDSLKEALQENVELVRAAGKAFLNIADQLNSRDNAQTLAEKIRQAIRRNSYGALSQADNLNSIVVAALTSD